MMGVSYSSFGLFITGGWFLVEGDIISTGVDSSMMAEVVYTINRHT